MKMTGNTILITGGTSGIGLGLAVRLHEAGNKVIVAGRRKELLDEITAEHPGIDAVVLDVADPDSIARAREAVAASHPGLNVLVNNAGIQLLESVLDPAGLQVAEDHVATNLLGTIRMTYAFLPLLVGKDDAVVMNVTSALAFVPFPITPTYSATKAALHSFSESLRIQLASADAGVQVIEVVPAGVRTTLMGQQDSEQSMPLDDFLTEVLDLLREKPDAKELVVEPARFIRDAVATGSYDDVLAMMTGS
ncbi:MULTISPECIES: SDR family oxidoreductase [Streptomyces]|uniref:Short-subunit dehydrogenase involved in D-alanine esterification of teichoic acids n=1 Tax=Streptomyces stelliscabiei TaxID=146820 RepID=A0A8I0TUH7_9ACTN|nr:MULTISPECIES: SDR family NAD(P)-dependent oxidoreductase [Streptomyces]KND40633.1 DltE [Streptomyces stelliscabiei]KQX63133.1 oxidoreductase [Streptomyces sp. Root1310]KRD22671.1 oxidoreductase [Streptomyces sp. Root264]MBE1600769.1 short-subunit dehydrogenase involved in D-alanine esterification of teichoic acids [Streptomyces stelliscabiei]MDX2519247.1 SDR family NAD(P)-dependent oxidoreductase [Streptomyces stelliscabiei]